MSVLAHARLPGGRLRGARWFIGGSFAAVALGAAAAVSPMLGVGVAVLIAVGAAIVVKPSSILTILMVSVFLEVMTVGGVTITRLIAPVALLVLTVELLRGSASLRVGPQFVCACAYAAYALASGLWTVSMSHTITLLASLAIAMTYMVCFAALLNSEEQLRRVLYVLAFGSLFVGAWSLASFGGHSLGPSDSLQSGRAQGGVGDPNFFANLQLVALPVILVLVFDAKARWLRYVLAGTALIGLASVLSTLSRGGLVALMFILFVIPFLPARALFASRQQKAMILLALTAGLLVLFTRPTFRAEVFTRATTIFTGTKDDSGSSSGSGRTEIWRAARQSISERPLLGLGFGAFPSRSNELMFRTPGVNLEKLSTHPHGIEAHSAFFGTAADLGLPGLALLVALLFSTGVALRRAAVEARRVGALFLSRVANALVLSLIGWTISSFFIETETARPLWIVIGLSLALPKLIDAARPDAPSSPPRRFS